jgi:hypothetical protein
LLIAVRAVLVQVYALWTVILAEFKHHQKGAETRWP